MMKKIFYFLWFLFSSINFVFASSFDETIRSFEKRAEEIFDSTRNSIVNQDLEKFDKRSMHFFLKQLQHALKDNLSLNELLTLGYCYQEIFYGHFSSTEHPIRPFRAYCWIHAELEAFYATLPEAVKTVYLQARAKFVERLKELARKYKRLTQKYNEKYRYELSDELGLFYFDFIDTVLQNDSGYFSEKLFEKIHKKELLSPLYRAKFIMTYLPRSLYFIGQVKNFDLAKIDILEIDASNKIVLVSNGCCSNLSICSFYIRGKEVYILSIKGKAQQHPDVKDGYEFDVKDQPYIWDKDNQVLSLQFGIEKDSVRHFRLDPENFRWIALED